MRLPRLVPALVASLVASASLSEPPVSGLAVGYVLPTTGERQPAGWLYVFGRPDGAERIYVAGAVNATYGGRAIPRGEPDE